MWTYLPLEPDFSYGQVRAKPEPAPQKPDFSPLIWRTAETDRDPDRETDRPARDPSVYDQTVKPTDLLYTSIFNGLISDV